ncbi:GNAT family N-acetyltransferase [Xenorhabdus kozodoii]|uniref:Acetyltransferase n=1 Tax=Xenorhabdus kozodoii TaxID=351676 RepID=A0A2D0L609_9GAMM|nr:GNAT family N-acetyltransferase [Xenorhabdus kozodoii]PHM71128.1 acetyltransferase [Xenorhabdus kozodoii]
MHKNNSTSCLIRSVNVSQWNATVLTWANAENWDMNTDDAARFFNVDPTAFFIAYRGIQPIASMSMVNYSDAYSFGGNFIIRPEFRHHVCAGKIWKWSIDHAEHRTIGCDGNWDRTELYEKRGFVIHYRNVRLSGVIKPKIRPPEGAILITPANIDEVIKYDAECTGVDRSALLANWFWGKERYGFCTYSRAGITGVIGLRRSQNGYRIGPFLADDPDAVETLALTAFAQIPDGLPVSADVPETDNNDFLQLANEYGLNGLFNTYRMYKGNLIPKGRLDKVKAIASLELG